jgi:regulator of sirC expression with transglutaminase-like and TPR domain
MPSLTSDLQQLLGETPVDLARTALAVSRVESPRVEIDASMTRLDDLGGRAAARLAALCDAPVRDRLAALSRLLYDEEGFRGNRDQYDDVRNSLLPVVLERRLGIPISLAVIYMVVAGRAGLEVFGVAFPGHFLLRVPNDAGTEADAIILDPFDGGRVLDRDEVGALLARHAGPDAALVPELLAPCTSRQIIVRMLNNLKRLYVGARSFAQAWQVTDLLVALDGEQPEDLRDRGLLAYHLDDFAGALRDLDAYLRVAGQAREDTEERRQIWDHVSTLRRRVAGMN